MPAHSYVQHLRGTAGPNLADERARVTRARAVRLELENARQRRELLPADEVARADEAIFIAIRDAFLALPDALAE